MSEAEAALLYERMAAHGRERISAHDNAEQRLRCIVSACLSVARDHEGLVRAAIFDGGPEERAAELRIARSGPVSSLLEEVLERGRDAGELRRQTDPVRAAPLLAELLRNALVESFAQKDTEFTRSIEPTLLDLFAFWGGVEGAPSLRELSGLEDVFAQICADLREETPFAFSRFGDGELRVVARYAGRSNGWRHRPPAPSRAHEYFPELGRRLHEVLLSRPKYLLGAPPLWFVRYRAELDKLTAGQARWVDAFCFRNAIVGEAFEQFFDALRAKRVILVGAGHLGALAEEQGWSFLEIPPRDCWLRHAETNAALTGELDDRDVFLFCAAMMSNVLIDELHRRNPDNTYVDMGSALDGYAGVKSRAYHGAVRARPAAS